MAYTIKKLEKSQVEFVITVSPEEYKKHLEPAAKRLSEKKEIKGFRKGKVPFDIVKKEFGEMAILDEALEKIIQETFYQAIKAEKLETIGMPKIDVEKAAPENDLVYKATVSILPKVKLPDLGLIKVEKKLKAVEDSHVEETIDTLRGMRASEVIKNGKAEGTDKLVIDMDMLIDNVPVDGGQAKDYQVYLSEKHYIPGFNEQVAGLQKGEEKQFALDFPQEHYQKHLAGKKVDFKVKVKDVFERQLPEVNEDFAKGLGQESVEKLKQLIRSNLLQESEQKAEQAAEIEILEQIIKKAEFEDIPEVLIAAEKQRIFYELKSNLEKNGVPIEKYLEDLKKTEKQLFDDFTQQAEKRAKAALISRQVALENNIVVEEKEIDSEIKMLEGYYKGSQEYLENLKRPEVRDSIATTLQNKKVIAWLKGKILPTKKEETKP
jgi:trigger factor